MMRLLRRFLADPYDARTLRALTVRLSISPLSGLACAVQRAWWARRGLRPSGPPWVGVAELRQTPDGSLGRALLEWAGRHGIDLEDTADLLETVERLGRGELVRLIVAHDLTHALLDADTGRFGELRVIGAQLGAGSPDVLAWFWALMLPLMAARSGDPLDALAAFAWGAVEGRQMPALATLAVEDLTREEGGRR